MKHSRRTRTRSERRTARRNYLRMALSLILLLLWAVPMFGGRVQPLPVIPALICIAMNEEFGFVIFCASAAGLLTDLACRYPLGATAIYFVIACAAVWLLFAELLRRGFLYWLLLTAVCTFLHAFLVWVLPLVSQSAAERSVLWTTVLLPSAGWTLLFALPVYLCYLPCGRLLTRRVRTMDAAAIRRDL